MALQVSVVAAWMALFTVLNVVAKIFVARIPSAQAGVLAIVKSLLLSPWLYLLATLYVLCALLYLAALRLMPLSLAGPILTAIGMLCTFTLGILFFGEVLSTAKTAGILFCGIGVWLLFSQGV